jgi:heme-degrading monooxygenase HmoA
MFVVVFEVQPKEGREQDYLELAASLQPGIEQVEGFVSVERFESLSQEGRLVSISYWRDDESVKRWREHNRHHLAQLSAREAIFSDYRITVAEIERQYGTLARLQPPQA